MEAIFRKGVSALITNSKNEFLLVNLQSFEEKFFAVPGGGVENGESLYDAVYREVEEELGIGRQSLEMVGVCKAPIRFEFLTKKIYRDGIHYDGSERYVFGFRFTGTDNEIKVQKSEIKSCKWVPYKDLDNYLLFEGQLEETRDKLLELFPFLR